MLKQERRAANIIQALVQEVQIGKIYKGKVVRIMDFGAFVEVIPECWVYRARTGLVHISQLDHNRVARVEDVVRVGDEIMVKATGIDKQGRLNYPVRKL
jgi:polyribonucleotide nucleotidyltransferase